MAQQVGTAPVILRRKQVESRCGLARSTLYRKIADNKFPKPVTLGDDGRAVGWIEAEVDSWIRGCVARRDGATA